MTFQRIMFRTSVSLKYEFTGAVGQPKWIIRWPGSYAPGYEHLADELLPVASVGITMLRPSATEPWKVEGIAIECSGSDMEPEPGTVTVTTSADQAQPRWLSDLISRAKTAVCHY